MPIDWFTVTAQALNFVVLVWLLKRFLYGPILRAVDAREQRVAAEVELIVHRDVFPTGAALVAEAPSQQGESQAAGREVDPVQQHRICLQRRLDTECQGALSFRRRLQPGQCFGTVQQAGKRCLIGCLHSDVRVGSVVKCVRPVRCRFIGGIAQN